MLTKRIIPCLDIKDGQTVKGVNFINLRQAGDPVELGARYAREGADELVFLDITATLEKRQTLIALVERIAATLDIPFTVGGGVRSVEDVGMLLAAGADKVAVNSAAVHKPELVDAIAREYGSQCLVLAIDARRTETDWRVFIHGGRTATERDVLAWGREVVARGAGEILLTSMDHDGTKQGFAIELTRRFAEALPVPVIASGGAGTMQHFVDIFTEGKADAALAASLFHFRELEIPALKDYLHENNIEVRR